MQDSKSLKKLDPAYIIVAVLMLISIVLIVVWLSSKGSAEADNRAIKDAVAYSEKIDKYYQKEYNLPEDLESAGIEDANKSIRYVKKDETAYKICVDFRAGQSGGFSLDPLSLIYGSAFGSLGSGYESSSEYTRSNLSEYDYYGHKKGEKCIEIKPYNNSSYNYNSSYEYGNSSAD
jgi:hypothetical protein